MIIVNYNESLFWQQSVFLLTQFGFEEQKVYPNGDCTQIFHLETQQIVDC